MPCIVIPRLLITVHEMPCIVIPSFLILIIILCTELLRLIQLEPLNLETLFKLCCVGLVNDTYAMLFKILKEKHNNVPIDLHWAIMTS